MSNNSDDFSDKVSEQDIINYLKEHAILLSQPNLTVSGRKAGSFMQAIYVDFDTGNKEENDKVYRMIGKYLCKTNRWCSKEELPETSQFVDTSQEADDIVEQLHNKHKKLSGQLDEDIYKKYPHAFQKKRFGVFVIIGDGKGGTLERKESNRKLKTLTDQMMRIDLSADAVKREFVKCEERHTELLSLLGDDAVADQATDGHDHLIAIGKIDHYKDSPVLDSASEFLDTTMLPITSEDNELLNKIGSGPLMRIKPSCEIVNGLIFSEPVMKACKSMLRDHHTPTNKDLTFTKPPRIIRD